MLKAPKFWSKKSFISRILVPFSWLYIFASKWRNKGFVPVKLPVPVICVGNLVMGGAGKTPTVISIVAILKSIGFTPHIISRGYGAVIHGVKKVDPEKHSYLNVGDEPLLLAKFAHTWVSTNRVKAGLKAIKSGADIIVMDDGFQNNSLVKDINLIVVDSIQGFGNQYVFPAGPLREPFKNGLNKADAIVVIGDQEVTYLNTAENKFYASFTHKMKKQKNAERVIAFAGLGYPKKFKRSLNEAGFKVVDFHAFPDHHPYTITEIDKLLKEAKNRKAKLITTSKDAVRLPNRFRKKIDVLKVNLEFKESEKIKDFLKEKLSI